MSLTAILQESPINPRHANVLERDVRDFEDIESLAKSYDCLSGDDFESRRTASSWAEVLFLAESDTDKKAALAERWYNDSVRSAEHPRNKNPDYDYASAGNAARNLFELTQGLVWVQRWHDAYIESANKSLDTHHKSHALGFAGKASRVRYSITNDKAHALNAFREYFESANLSHNAGYRSRTYLKAAEVGTGLFLTDGDASLGKQIYEAFLHGADPSSESYLMLKNHMGDVTRRLFKVTGETHWLEKAIEDAEYYADHTPNLKAQAHSLGFIGRDAMLLFGKTRDPHWAVKSYLFNLRSAEIAEDPRYKAHAYSFAADAARELFNVTGDVSMANKAKECYDNFLKLAPGVGISSGVIGTVRRQYAYLERKAA